MGAVSSRRVYAVGDKYLPSVTTILGVLNKPALVPWAAKVEREMVTEAAKSLYRVIQTYPHGPGGGMVDEASYALQLSVFIGKTKAHAKIMAVAGEIGSEIHSLAEYEARRMMGLMLGPRPQVKPEAEEAFKKWVLWKDSLLLFQPVFLEQKLINMTFGYAGRMDLTANIQKEGEAGPSYTLIDYKSGKGIYVESIIQVAAYIKAIESMKQEVPVRAVICRLPKNIGDPDPEVRWVEKEELDNAFGAFLHTMAMYEWVKKNDPWEKKKLVEVVPEGKDRSTT